MIPDSNLIRFPFFSSTPNKKTEPPKIDPQEDKECLNEKRLFSLFKNLYSIISKEDLIPGSEEITPKNIFQVFQSLEALSLILLANLVYIKTKPKSTSIETRKPTKDKTEASGQLLPKDPKVPESLPTDYSSHSNQLFKPPFELLNTLIVKDFSFKSFLKLLNIQTKSISQTIDASSIRKEYVQKASSLILKQASVCTFFLALDSSPSISEEVASIANTFRRRNKDKTPEDFQGGFTHTNQERPTSEYLCGEQSGGGTLQRAIETILESHSDIDGQDDSFLEEELAKLNGHFREHDRSSRVFMRDEETLFFLLVGFRPLFERVKRRVVAAIKEKRNRKVYSVLQKSLGRLQKRVAGELFGRLEEYLLGGLLEGFASKVTRRLRKKGVGRKYSSGGGDPMPFSERDGSWENALGGTVSYGRKVDYREAFRTRLKLASRNAEVVSVLAGFLRKSSVLLVLKDSAPELSGSIDCSRLSRYPWEECLPKDSEDRVRKRERAMDGAIADPAAAGLLYEFFSYYANKVALLREDSLFLSEGASFSSSVFVANEQYYFHIVVQTPSYSLSPGEKEGRPQDLFGLIEGEGAGLVKKGKESVVFGKSLVPQNPSPYSSGAERMPGRNKDSSSRLVISNLTSSGPVGLNPSCLLSEEDSLRILMEAVAQVKTILKVSEVSPGCVFLFYFEVSAKGSEVPGFLEAFSSSELQAQISRLFLEEGGLAVGPDRIAVLPFFCSVSLEGLEDTISWNQEVLLRVLASSVLTEGSPSYFRPILLEGTFPSLEGMFVTRNAGELLKRLAQGLAGVLNNIKEPFQFNVYASKEDISSNGKVKGEKRNVRAIKYSLEQFNKEIKGFVKRYKEELATLLMGYESIRNSFNVPFGENKILGKLVKDSFCIERIIALLDEFLKGDVKSSFLGDKPSSLESHIPAGCYQSSGKDRRKIKKTETLLKILNTRLVDGFEVEKEIVSIKLKLDRFLLSLKDLLDGKNDLVFVKSNKE